MNRRKQSVVMKLQDEIVNLYQFQSAHDWEINIINTIFEFTVGKRKMYYGGDSKVISTLITFFTQ